MVHLCSGNCSERMMVMGYGLKSASGIRECLATYLPQDVWATSKAERRYYQTAIMQLVSEASGLFIGCQSRLVSCRKRLEMPGHWPSSMQGAARHQQP
jgi:hypothetical protein